MIGKFVVNLALVFAIAAGAATAADWEVLDAEPDEAMLLDKNSIHHDGRIEYLGEPVYPHRSRVTLYEIDCRNGQLGYAAWSFQSGELGGGTTVWADTARGVTHFPPDADSSEAALLARVCGSALAHGGDPVTGDSRPYTTQE